MELQKPKECENIIKKQTITKSDIALYALYLLGRDKEYIHFEEIFLKCYELDKSSFSWDTKDYPSDRRGRFAIKDIREKTDFIKPKGVDRGTMTHYILTKPGLNYIEEKIEIFQSISSEKKLNTQTKAASKAKKVLSNLVENIEKINNSEDDYVEIHQYLDISTSIPLNIKLEKIDHVILESEKYDYTEITEILERWKGIV